MKTITMDFSEYEQVVNERDAAQKDVREYIEAISIVYGAEIANSILSRADDIRESQHRVQLHNAFHSGKL